jgi:ABC-type multidrug transport system fused ATPase/permease subunit
MIENFLKGKYRLAIVFWGFAVLVSVVYNLISIYINQHLFKLSDYEYFELVYNLFFALPFIYFPLVMLAVWNSAQHYSGRKIWAIAAKIVMGIWAAALIYYGSSYLFSQYSDKYSESDLIELSQNLNKSLPQEIEPNVWVTKTSFERNRFMFQYQISNRLRSELQVKAFVIAFKDELKNQVCNDKFTQKVLNNHFILDYQYIDKNNTEIYTFNFKKEDCSIK